MTMVSGLPSVCGQRRLAGLAQPRAVLLQAGQHNHVAVIEMGAAEARGIARAGILALLLRRGAGGRDQDKRNRQNKSGHRVTPSYPCEEGVLEPETRRGNGFILPHRRKQTRRCGTGISSCTASRPTITGRSV